MRVALTFLFACSVFGQAAQPRISGVVLVTGPTLEADAIVVGALTGGTVVDVFPQVEVGATLRPERVIKGVDGNAPLLNIHWSYIPNPIEGPPLIRTVPQDQALWFLKKDATGYRVLRPHLTAGDFRLPVSPGALDTRFLYPADAPPAEKLAMELLAAFAPCSSTRSYECYSVSSLLWQTAGELSLPFLRGLRTIPDKHAQAFGLAGLLRLDDPQAFAILEAEAPMLAASAAGSWFSAAVGGLKLVPPVEELHTLGRVAVRNPELQRFQEVVAYLLGESRTPEVLPYLGSILQSPDGPTSLAAGRALCQMFWPNGPPASADRYWLPEMAGICLNRPGPPYDDVAPFWKEWWASTRLQIPELASLSARPGGEQ